jgi:chemotaxis protein MotB
MVVEMSASNNVAPVIIKKVKKSGGDAHHGGAWKVAYADFVTAMMAFFLMMWLLSSTTETQRSGIADYFAPTISIARTSGGGDGAFGGDSVFTEETRSQNGEGATLLNPTEADAARGIEGDPGARAQEEEAFSEIEEKLVGKSGESLLEENELRHVVTEVTDEGLVIEIFDLPGAPLFRNRGSDPMPVLIALAQVIQSVSREVTNDVAVEAHVAAEPVIIKQSAVWSTSSGRAETMRRLLVDSGMADRRLRRVTGHADREPAVRDPMAPRNNRLEIILLRNGVN